MKCFILFLQLLFSYSLVLADVIFIDINASWEEIRAAKKSVKRRGEKLIVIPDMKDSDRRAIYNINVKLLKIKKRVESACLKETSNQCKSWESKYAALYKTKEPLTGKVSDKSMKEQIELAMAKIEPKEKLNSIIISGHDGNGSFSGDLGRFQNKDLEVALNNNPKRKKEVNAIHLWGCYSATAGECSMRWLQVAPNLKFVSGYNALAPLNVRPASWNFLEGILDKESMITKLAEKNRQEQISKVLRRIKNVNITTGTICTQTHHIGYGKNSTKSYREIMGKCFKYIKDPSIVVNFMAKYTCYSKARKGCEDIPKNHANNKLRDFYNFLQESSQCFEDQAFLDKFRNLPSRDHLIRLIYFDEIVNNFSRNYQIDLNELDKTLDKMNAPERIRFSNIHKLSRKEILDRISMLRSFLDDEVKNLPIEDKIKHLETFGAFANLQTHLGAVNSHCVPFSWVENASLEPSSCTKSLFNKAFGSNHVSDLLGEQERKKIMQMSEELSGNNDKDLSKIIEINKIIFITRKEQLLVYFSARDFSGLSLKQEEISSNIFKKNLERYNELILAADDFKKFLIESLDVENNKEQGLEALSSAFLHISSAEHSYDYVSALFKESDVAMAEDKNKELRKKLMIRIGAARNRVADQMMKNNVRKERMHKSATERKKLYDEIYSVNKKISSYIGQYSTSKKNSHLIYAQNLYKDLQELLQKRPAEDFKLSFPDDVRDYMRSTIEGHLYIKKPQMINSR